MDRLKLNLEQIRFELQGSTCMQIFSRSIWKKIFGDLQ